jgi:hypothetical protein
VQNRRKVMNRTVYLLVTDCSRPMLVGAFTSEDVASVQRVMSMFGRRVKVVDDMELDENTTEKHYRSQGHALLSQEGV